MAWTEDIEKITCRILVQIGTSSTGAVKTANVTLPAISASGYTSAAFGAISDLYEPILNESIYKLNAIKTYYLQND